MKKAKGWTLIRNGALFDGSGSPPKPDSCLVIKDGLIHFAGPAAQAPAVPPDAVVVDARKGTILPGEKGVEQTAPRLVWVRLVR